MPRILTLYIIRMCLFSSYLLQVLSTSAVAASAERMIYCHVIGFFFKDNFMAIFWTKMSRFWQFFDIQMAIFQSIRLEPN